MTLTRTWPYPDLRNGTTINHITDTHFGAAGNATWLDNWFDRTRRDMERLKVAHQGHIHTGDMIHWDVGSDIGSEDAKYVSWRNRIKTFDGLPYAEAVGNHDLDTFQTTSTAKRTAAEWAAAMGIPSQNMVTAMGDVKVITIGPDTWADGSDYILSTATLDWLDAQLTAAGSTPCWIAAHIALEEQFPTIGTAANTADVGNPRLIDIIGAHTNVIGWLSGHYHVDIANTNHARAMTVGGRRIWGINGPPAGGGRWGSVAAADHQWQNPNQSMFVTYLGDAVDVRWRDHNRGQWTDAGGSMMRHLLLT